MLACDLASSQLAADISIILALSQEGLTPVPSDSTGCRHALLTTAPTTARISCPIPPQLAQCQGWGRHPPVAIRQGWRNPPYIVARRHRVGRHPPPTPLLLSRMYSPLVILFYLFLFTMSNLLSFAYKRGWQAIRWGGRPLHAIGTHLFELLTHARHPETWEPRSLSHTFIISTTNLSAGARELELDVGTFCPNQYKILCLILTLPSEFVMRA